MAKSRQPAPGPRPGPASGPASGPDEAIAANVRQRRALAGLSLEELARRSGVSATMLSEVERGVKHPTVRLAWSIARALHCSLSELVEPARAAPLTIVRAAERRSLVDPESGVARHGMSGEWLRRGLEVVAYELPAGASAGEMAPNRPGVVEAVFVLSGRLTLVLGGAAHTLAAGDSATYGPQVVTEYKNTGRGRVEFLLLSDSSRAL